MYDFIDRYRSTNDHLNFRNDVTTITKNYMYVAFIAHCRGLFCYYRSSTLSYKFLFSTAIRPVGLNSTLVSDAFDVVVVDDPVAATRAAVSLVVISVVIDDEGKSVSVLSAHKFTTHNLSFGPE